jgi:MraZ protein
MFLGEFEHTIDDKNRITLPARFRHAFGDGAVVTRELETCLGVYTRAGFESLRQERLSIFNPLTREGRQMRRYLFAGAIEAELDKQGRVGLPPALIEHASLAREVVVAGVEDHLEIWDRDAWRRERAEFEGRAGDVAERIAAERD